MTESETPTERSQADGYPHLHEPTPKTWAGNNFWIVVLGVYTPGVLSLFWLQMEGYLSGIWFVGSIFVMGFIGFTLSLLIVNLLERRVDDDD